jgi:hypothetical protein
MASSASAPKKARITPVILSAIIVIALITGLFYLSRPAPKAPQEGPASPEVKAYVPNLTLSDVSMKATENFMKQQVVEVEGKITNNGPRPLESIEVYCLFYDANGREIHRERLPIFKAKNGPLKPKQSASFRLPFDNLPDSWNQTVPKLVIAQITFAD